MSERNRTHTHLESGYGGPRSYLEDRGEGLPGQLVVEDGEQSTDRLEEVGGIRTLS
jgi:hypothetical protein